VNADAPKNSESERYEVLGEIGRGGMGIVYRAISQSTGRFVAIKKLVLENIAPEKRDEFKDRFKREAYTIARLKHANIVDVTDISCEGTSFFYVMEFLDGESLRKDLLRRGGRMPLANFYPILSQIGHALSFAHSMNIVHRDVKPDNIFILKDGTVKLTDFGIARAADFEDANLTKTGIMMGTLAYVSPEQLQDAKSVDHRADIFSLAVVCYEALSGTLPFTADGIAATIVKIISQEETPLHILDPSIPIHVSNCVSRAMRKKPKERYRSVSEFIKDLSTALTEEEKLTCATLAEPTYEQVSFKPVKTQFGLQATTVDGSATQAGSILVSTSVNIAEPDLVSTQVGPQVNGFDTPVDLQTIADDEKIAAANQQFLETRHEHAAAEKHEPAQSAAAPAAGAAPPPRTPRKAEESLKHVLTVTQQGSGKRFEEPAVLTCKNGKLAIADAVTRTINVFAYDGLNIEQSLRWLFEVSYKPAAGVNAANSRTKCGSITRPGGLSFDMKGRLFCCDASDQYVRIFDGRGSFLSEFRNIQAKDSGLAGMAMDSTGQLYVSDSANACVQVFQPETGVWLRSISGKTDLDMRSKSAYQDDRAATAIRLPAGLATDRLNQIYLADYGASKIFVFNKAGTLIRHFGSKGSGEEELNIPRSVAVDRFDRIYVCDSFNNRLSVFDSGGRSLFTYGEKGNAANQLSNPSDIAIDNQFGIVFVCDRGNRRLQIYRIPGNFAGQDQ
jgi:serine/threonine protein kinase/DNA-binding beta-propeller fold protein YncE